MVVEFSEERTTAGIAADVFDAWGAEANTTQPYNDCLMKLLTLYPRDSSVGKEGAPKWPAMGRADMDCIAAVGEGGTNHIHNNRQHEEKYAF